MNAKEPDAPRPNYRAIAQTAGVSVSTISRYFNGHLRLRPETESRVQSAAAQLGYQPITPRRPRQNKGRRAIGMIVPHVSNSYFGALVDAVARFADAQGYWVSVAPTLDNSRGQLDSVTMMTNLGVEGLVYIGNYRTNAALEEAADDNLPMVVVDEDIAGIRPTDTVLVDDYAGSYQATTFLCAQGHKEIALFTGPRALRSSQQRERAFRDALTGHEIDPDEQLVLHGSFNEDFGSAALSRLMSTPRRPTAVFAASDAIALGILGAARTFGITIPADLSVVGFDDIPEARLVTPALTTVRTPLEQMARQAVTLLIDRIEGTTEEPQTTLVPVRLEVRDSTRAVS